jgi:hypothetical protein
MIKAVAEGDKEKAKQESERCYVPKSKEVCVPMKDRNERTKKFIDAGEEWKKFE